MFTAKARVRRPSRSSQASKRRAQARESAVGAFRDMNEVEDLEIQVTLLRAGHKPVHYMVPYGIPLRLVPGFRSGYRHYLVLNGQRVIILPASQRLIDANVEIRQVKPQQVT